MEPAAARAVVDAAHELDLAVHPWTFRREAMYVDRSFESDSEEELRFFYECLNVDALFVEFPDQASMVIERMLSDDSDATAVAVATGGGVATPSNPAGLGAGAESSKTTAHFPSRRGRNNRSNRSSSSSSSGAATQNVPLFTPTSPSSPPFSSESTTSTTDAAGAAAGVAPAATAAAAAAARPSAGSTVAMLFSMMMGGVEGSGQQQQQQLLEGGREGESEACMQMRHARACSVDGVGGGSYRLPSNVVPWFKRKSF